MKDKKFNTPTVRFGIPNLAAKVPRFWHFKIPLPGGVYMGGGKLIIASLSAVAIGFLASLPSLLLVVILEYVLTGEEKLDEMKKQTKLLEELVAQENLQKDEMVILDK